MEFQAYSSPSQSAKASALWQIQNTLHNGESLLLPGILLFTSAGFVMYEHFSATHGWDSNRNFLAMILVTMLPLAFLEKKVLSCSDPLTTMSKFSGKVLLSHGCFLVMRVPQHYMHDGILSLNFLSCLLALSAACVLWPVCFRVRSFDAVFHQNWDVWVVVVLGWTAAIVTEGVNKYFDEDSDYKFLEATIATAALYIELLAFVPAVWMVCRGDRDTREAADVSDTRRRALALFTFLVGFYFLEDVVSAIMWCRLIPLASLGHLAHFALLLDFAFFLLSHLYDPTKMGKFMGALKLFGEAACAV